MRDFFKARVITRAGKNQVSREGDVLRIKLNAVPLKGEANKVLIKVLAEYFNRPKKDIKIVKGMKAKNKIISLEKGGGLNPG